jgi:predicted Abi (CAAX) family protease
VTIRSALLKRLRDLRDAIVTIPDGRSWRACALVYLVFLTCAAPIGLLSGLLKPGVPRLSAMELIAAAVSLLARPALVEEIVFRGLLLPRDPRAIPRGRVIAVAAAALVVYVAAHPVNALLTWPASLRVFGDPVYLGLTTLLGIACTVAYWISRSIWPPVVMHWATVVVWLWLLGGQSLLS